MIRPGEIYDLVRKIPEGKVATYGQIAGLLGYPRHARYVGQALSRLESNGKVPWHRVINAKGRISPGGFTGRDDYQRLLLEEENIVFREDNSISLTDYLWRPEQAASVLPVSGAETLDTVTLK